MIRVLLFTASWKHVTSQSCILLRFLCYCLFCVGTVKCLIITPCGLLDRGRWSCIKQETIKKGGEEIQSPREACQSRTSSWRTVSSIKSAWWVCVPPVPGLFISWLWSWGYDTVHPLSYDSVCFNCSGVMVPCLLSHNHVDFSFDLWVMMMCVPYLTTLDFSCGPRGLVLCSVVGSFYHFRRTCIFRVDCRWMQQVPQRS